MNNEKNPQDESTLTELEKPVGLQPPEHFTPDHTEKPFSYSILTIDLSSAITNQEYEIKGEKIYYMEGQSRLTIRLDTRTKPGVYLYPGRRIVAPFTRFYVTAPAADEIITLLVASPKWVEMHGEGVEVNQLIRDKTAFRETELRRAFWGRTSEAAAAGVFSHIQLWNPSDSGIIAIVDQCDIHLVDNTLFDIGCYNVALSGNDGNGCNKICGDSISICELRSEQIDVSPVTDCARYRALGYTYVRIFQSNVQKVMLKPGYGMTANVQAVNKFISGTWHWFELPEGNISGF